MRLLDLTLEHVGQLVMLSTEHWCVIGRLEAYDVDHDVIYDQDLSAPEPTRVLGVKTVRLRVGPWEGSLRDISLVDVSLL